MCVCVCVVRGSCFIEGLKNSVTFEHIRKGREGARLQAILRKAVVEIASAKALR